MRSLILGSLVVLGVASCGSDAVCVPPPCPQQIAIDLNVTSSGGMPVPGFMVTVTGASAAVSCLDGLSECLVIGSRGTYHLTVSAPGFQPVQQTVQVTSSGTHGCNTCDVPNTQHVSVTLAPAVSG